MENEHRCTLIEKKILLEMGVSPKIVEQWERRVTQAKRQDPDAEVTEEKQAPKPSDGETQEDEDEPEVILPEWHQDESRSALRRRHVKAAMEREKQDMYHQDHRLQQDQDLVVSYIERQEQERNVHGKSKNPIDSMVVNIMARLVVLFFGTLLVLWWRHLWTTHVSLDDA